MRALALASDLVEGLGRTTMGTAMAGIDSGPIAFDVAARHAEVVGESPRIAPLKQAELSAESLDLCVAIRESVGVHEHSVIPDYMLTMFKHPEIFRCQMEMGTVLFQGRLPARERELAVLRVGWLMRAPYEWGQHVVIAKRYGLSDEEVERVTQGSAAEGWSAHYAAILRGVEELIGGAAICDDTWAELAKSWDEAQLIEFPMMVGQYVATAYVQNALRMRLVPSNPGLTLR
ncbi:MAG: carboxymuconolactone decarboxylase family protein [Novosphingobium sp.]